MYIHMYNFGEVRARTHARTRIQFLFPVDFGAHVYFQLTIHRSQNLVDFLPLSMPFCAFGAKRHGTGKNKFSFDMIVRILLI